MRFRTRSLLPLAVLAMLPLGCEHTTTPTTSVERANGQVIFGSYDGEGGWRIYIVNDNGSGLKRLADGNEICISPDGKSVLFTATSGSDMNNICVMNIDGSSARNLTRSGVSCSDAHWSPDGSLIVYQRGPAGSTDNVWVMNADGNGQRQVTKDTTGFNFQPRWFPDGRRILFLWGLKDPTGKVVTGLYELRLINLDGSGERMVVRKPAEYPEVSPDGSMISFTRGDSGYVVNADGSGLRPLVPSEPGLSMMRVSWCADWSYGVFSTKKDNVVYLFVVKRDGSGKKLLTQFNGGYLHGYGWSPDQKRIAFSYGSGQSGSPYGGALYVINADGTNLKRITDDVGAYTEVHWVPLSQ